MLKNEKREREERENENRETQTLQQTHDARCTARVAWKRNDEVKDVRIYSTGNSWLRE